MSGSNFTVVVGGGPVGLVAAIRLRRMGYEVLLLEGEQECGGLMRSLSVINGFEFDYGARFVPRLDDPVLDAEALHQPDAWLEFCRLRSGSFFAGRLQDRTGFLDICGLPAEIRSRVEEGYYHKTGDAEVAQNADELIRSKFGSAALDHVFAPVLKKLTGFLPTSLSPSVIPLYGLSRLVMFTPEHTRSLKKSDTSHDKHLAYHCRDEGNPTDPARVFRYPVRGGIGTWAQRLEEIARRDGVVIRSGTFVEKVESARNGCIRLMLPRGNAVETRKLVWTLPASLLLRAANAMPQGATPPGASSLLLYHFVVDRDFATRLFYLTNYDPAYATYRVTLYPNVQGRAHRKDQYHLTVEVIVTTQGSEAPGQPQIARELIEMGVVRPGTRILAHAVTRLRRGFPLPTYGIEAVQHSHEQLARALLPAATVLGRGQSGTFFLRDALSECFRELM